MMKPSLIKVLVAGAVLAATAALAEPDTFFLGNGSGGSYTAPGPDSIINSYAQVTKSVSVGATQLEVASTTGFQGGDLVLVLQTTGIESSPPSNSQTAIDLSSSSVGRWELARVASVVSGSPAVLNLTAPLIQAYTKWVTQVVRVPEYVNVTVPSNASIVARPWDGSTGGVLAFLAQGTVTNNGKIDASGTGFRGGLFVLNDATLKGCSELDTSDTDKGAQRGEGIDPTHYGAASLGRGIAANGGGGGVCKESGGGGGGNGGAGGQGGNSLDGARAVGGLGGGGQGIGEISGFNPPFIFERLLLGGGGGSGHGSGTDPGADGGRGGGIIFIRGQQLAGTGTGTPRILASGSGAADSTGAAGSGGGAGGTIVARFAGTVTCGSPVQAIGGKGGSSGSNGVGPGGGGGGGRVFFQAAVGSGCTTLDVSAGGAGSDKNSSPNGAKEGSVGKQQALLQSGFPELKAPVITSPLNGAVTNDATPLLTGTIEESGSLVIYVDGVEFERTPVGVGSFSHELVRALGAGPHTIEVALADQGVQSPRSTAVTLTVDLEPPQFTIEGAPAEGARTKEQTASFSLNVTTTETLVTFECQLDGASLNPCGTSLELTGLVEGGHTLRVHALDAAGNRWPWDEATKTWGWVERKWTVDLHAPAAPSLSVPVSGLYLSAAQPEMRGAAEAGATVRFVLDDSSLMDVVTADKDGNWTYAPALLDGAHEGVHWVRLSATDEAGNTSDLSKTYFFTVDTLSPAVPLVSAPSAGALLNTAVPLVQGTAEGGSWVTVALDTRSEFVVKANADGAWSFVPSPVLGEGAHSLKVKATDAAGNASALSAAYGFNVDTQPPARPTVTAPAQAAVLNSATPTIQGTAERNSHVTLYVNDLEVAQVDADAGGAWSYVPGNRLPEGLNWVRVTARDAAGNTSSFSNTNAFTVDSVPPSVPSIVAPSDGAYVNTSSPVFRGLAEPGTTVTLILDGAAQSPVVASSSGAWSFAAPLSLSEAPHTLKVQSVDGASNSSESAQQTFTVDVTPPDTFIDAGPAPAVNQTEASFVFRSSPDVGVNFECKLDAETDFTGCSTSYSVASGEHTLFVRARDKAGNVDPTPAIHTWVVDLVKPQAPVLTAPASGAYVPTSSPVISGTAEPASTVEVVLDGGVVGTVMASATGTWSFPIASSLVDGTHTVKATAKDQAGNVGPASSERSFTVDTHPPESSIVSGPPAAQKSALATFTFSSNEAPVSFECSLDGAEFLPCDSPHDVDVGPDGDGTHTLRVRAKDAAGNVDATPSSSRWTVDRVAPETLLTQNPPALTNQPTVEFRFASNEEGVDYECSLDSADPANPLFIPCTSPYPVNVSDGPHTFQVHAVDKAGNIDVTAASYSWTVDLERPARPTVESPGEGGYVNTESPVIQGHAEPGAQVSVYKDDALLGTVTANPQGDWLFIPPVALGQGAQAVKVVARDAAGNVSDASDVRHFTVDSIVPDTQINKAPPSLANESLAVFEFSSPEVGVSFECSLNGSAFTPCESPYSKRLSDGNYTFTVRARDAAGNVDPVPASHSWTVDATPPDTFILSGPTDASQGTTNKTEARFTFGTNAPNVTYYCNLDGAGFNECPSNYQVTGLAIGGHVLEVKARDSAGNEDDTPASWSWAIDTNIPDTIIVVAPKALSNTLTAYFEFQSNKSANDTFVCSLDDGSFVPCPQQVTLSVFGDGVHTLKVKARDELGNEDPEPAVHTWTVDTRRPETRINQNPAELVNTSLCTFGFESNESGGRFECSLDGAAFVGCTSPVTLEVIDGPHTLQIRAWDAADNVDESPAVYTWRVDTAAPGVPTLSAPAPGALVATATPVLEGSGEPGSRVFVSLDGAEVSSVVVNDSGRWSLSSPQPFGEGAHSITVRAEDAAGNGSATSEAFAVTVDTQAPETTIVSGPEGRVRAASVTFQFSSSEEGARFECSFDNAEFAPCEAEVSFDVTEGVHSLQVRARDRAGNVDSSPVSRSWRVYLGNDSRAKGGGLSCATTSTGGSGPSLALLGLVGLSLLVSRRHRA